ncbi:DNA cytosine methyltransferase [Alicyclobacillus fodiniaquatilis]|uniref:DNA (cytosine-5-)-methyltransferase n=1 Tax=Alicyclobacillus fodiniaquatilis TaxID=1661150 RepID=A0ABW4JGI7_9BACL
MPRKQTLNLFNTSELIIDNFAGGGGASTGIESAIGRSVDIAINHDPAAIAMHKANHPTTEHYCESVWDVDPREVTGGRPVGLCWLSPDCKHFSKAKGGKPVEKKIRGLAWVAVRWAATVRPRVIILENVEEFKTWGPLLKNGKPDPKQKGRTFNCFVNALRRHGYQVEWREMRACDYGAPTIRKRLFLIARCDGRPIVWPKPTHGDPNCAPVRAKRLKPWRTAAEIIDWSLPCPSIFERKRPLAENTMRRIARGMAKFVIEGPQPFIIKVNHHGTEFRGQTLDKPLHTITAGGDSKRPAGAPHAMGMVTAFLAQYHTETAHSEVRGQSLDEPIMTLDTSNRYGLVAAFLAKHYGGNYTGPGSPMDVPVPTVTTVDHNALVTSHLMILRNNQFGQKVTQPIPTVTAGGGHVGEVRAFLTQYNGSSIGQRVDTPLNTISTHDRFGLVIVRIKGQDYVIVDIGMRMLEPHELFAAQGFPAEYIINRDADGRIYPKSAQVARCGNSVPPPFAEHLVRANLPEMCLERAG